MTFVIEKGIPMPTSSGRDKSGIASVLRSMEVGDSIMSTEKNRSNLQNYAKRIGVKVVGRKMETGSVRFWRVE